MTPCRPDSQPVPAGLDLGEAATASSGWHAVGHAPAALSGARLGATLHDPCALLGPRPASVAELPPARGGLRAVPISALVPIGRPGKRGGLRPPRSANDNLPPPRPTAPRPLWRDLLVLALLFATVAGAFWGGRLHASYKVIVVPGPSSSRSVVT